MKRNYLMFTVLRPRSSCSNGGVTTWSDHIMIRCADGPMVFDADDPNEPRRDLLFRPEPRGGGYWAAIPEVLKPGLCGPMCGGCLAETSDSRSGGIVYRIHDRFETSEHNALLSE